MSELEIICKKNGVEFIEFSHIHVRLVGGITIDLWPTKNKAWIMGTDKSWIYANSQEIMDVANLKIFPKGIKWKTRKSIERLADREYINVETLCPACHKNLSPKRKTFTERQIGN